MIDNFDKELIPTNQITPFDSSEEIQTKLKENFFSRKKITYKADLCLRCRSGKPDITCPNFANCPFVSKNSANTIINKFKDFTEVVFYKSCFYVPDDVFVNRKVDKSRKWVKDEFGVLSPKSCFSKVEDLQKTIKNSRKRALDMAYGYILCNDWQYFVTVTFKHGKDRKLSDDVVKYQWKKFREQLQYRFPDIKIILFPEDTPTGVNGLHFHGFFGNADLSEFLRPAVNNKKFYKGELNSQYKEFLYTEFGDPVFNFLNSFVNVGYTTVVKIKENSNKLKLINYMTKYMSKGSSNFEYNEKSYLHTHNLAFKEKQVANFSIEDKNNLVNSLFAVCYKDTKNFTVYRIYKDKA